MMTATLTVAQMKLSNKYQATYSLILSMDNTTLYSPCRNHVNVSLVLAALTKNCAHILAGRSAGRQLRHTVPRAGSAGNR